MLQQTNIAVENPLLVDRFHWENQSFLVGGLEHFLFFNILGIIIPTDFHIFFRGVGQPPTSD